MSVLNTKRVFTKTKTLSGGRSVYRTWKDWDVGDIIVGQYEGTQDNKFNASKSNYVFKIIESFIKDKEFEALIPEGATLVLNTVGMLEKAMKKANEGEIFQITYTGMGPIEKGIYAGKEAHSMEVILCQEEVADAKLEEDL